MTNKARIEKLEAAVRPAEDDTITVVLYLRDGNLEVNGEKMTQAEYDKTKEGKPPHKIIEIGNCFGGGGL